MTKVHGVFPAHAAQAMGHTVEVAEHCYGQSSAAPPIPSLLDAIAAIGTLLAAPQLAVVTDKRAKGIALSPPTSEGTRITDITGHQGPTRWRRGTRLPGPRRPVAQEARSAAAG